MTNLPEELKEFPHHLLEKLRQGVISPREKQELLEIGSGWLYRLSEINTEAHSEYKIAIIGAKHQFAQDYALKRATGESVSGSKLWAETRHEYIDALVEETKAEKRWRYFKGFYEANLECLNSLKISIKLDLGDQKYVG